MPGFRVLRRNIGMPLAYDFHDARDFGILAAVIEKAEVPPLHIVAHEVAGLIVPHPVPARSLIGRVFKIGKRITVGFAFEEPMPHGSVLLRERFGHIVPRIPNSCKRPLNRPHRSIRNAPPMRHLHRTFYPPTINTI